MANRISYINTRKLTQLASRIAFLEDEFRACRLTKQNRAAIEAELGYCYKLLMHEVRRNNLAEIQFINNKIRVTFINNHQQ